jgi:hypothetical protein
MSPSYPGALGCAPDDRHRERADTFRTMAEFKRAAPAAPRWKLIGRDVLDSGDIRVGKVVDTNPPDGGGEVSLVLVSVGDKFPRYHWLPVKGATLNGDSELKVGWSRAEISEGPEVGDARWGEPTDVARAYWALADDTTRKLTKRPLQAG